MTDNWRNNGPVVIGGLGGSGTRVVAEIMSALGFFIGRDLNLASDNLWYTLLFKRPTWYPEHRFDKEKLSVGLRFLQKAMLRSSWPTAEEFSFLVSAANSSKSDGFSHKHVGAGRPRWMLKRLWRMATRGPIPGDDYHGWGWKEPNTHLLIDDMARTFENFKYIHTVRHGLDMAFSDNQNQLHLWGRFFDVELPEERAMLPRASYRFWVNANRAALKEGRKLGDGRFLLLNFDKLCCDPEPEIARLTDFLGVQPPDTALSQIRGLVSPPRSIGRYKEHELGLFEGEDLGALPEFGFVAVEGACS